MHSNSIGKYLGITYYFSLYAKMIVD